jgi:hypothetical protein
MENDIILAIIREANDWRYITGCSGIFKIPEDNIEWTY